MSQVAQHHSFRGILYSLLIFQLSQPISNWAGTGFVLWCGGIIPALIAHWAGFVLGPEREIH